MGSNWRDHDLRGAQERPHSVRSVVHGVARTLTAFRLVESVHLGGACAMLVMAAALESGALFEDGEAWGLAALCGIAAGLLWWTSHRITRSRLAVRLDRRLRHGGALVAAYDAEVAGRVPSTEQEAGAARASFAEREGDLSRLLCLRVLARLRRRDAQRAVLPSPALAVLAPLFGVFLLVAAIERRDAALTQPPADPAALAAGLLAALDDARGALQEGQAGSAEHEELFGLERRAREIVGALRQDPADPEAQRALEELDRDLARQGSAEGASPDLRRRLEAARTWLDGASSAIAAHRGEPARNAQTGESGSLEGRGEGSRETAAGNSGVVSALSSSSEPIPPDSLLEGEPAGGTIPGPDAVATELPAEKGTAALGRWWPARHEALVERWVDERRAALERARANR